MRGLRGRTVVVDFNLGGEIELGGRHAGECSEVDGVGPGCSQHKRSDERLNSGERRSEGED